MEIPSSAYVESLYERYRTDPSEIDPQWISFLQGYDFAQSSAPVTQVGGIDIPPTTFFNVVSFPPPSTTSTWSDLDRKVWLLVQAYRNRSHLYANTSIFLSHFDENPQELQTERFFLSPQDLDLPTKVAQLMGFDSAISCKQLIAHLTRVYLSTMGVEMAHIDEDSVRTYVCEQLEHPQSAWQNPSKEFAQFIWTHLVAAAGFESFLQSRYVGKKRFGLEGQDSLIPGLQALLRKAPASGCKEVLFCMAHRGRLNVLVNVLQKPLQQVFAEFEESPLVSGYPDVTWDVKYHLGFSNDISTPTGPLHVSMAYNPSHLESVNGVLLGVARAKQELQYQHNQQAVLPIIIHGDAAVAGQGSVYEAACLYALEGYSVGGAIHIVLNNLVGFTATPEETKSSRYCTDLAKVMNAPVFHVNAEDPLAVAHALEVALAVRQKEKVDVFVEIVGFRKFGHNEGDDPRFTQPTLYQQVDAYPGVLEMVEKRFVTNGLLVADDLPKQKADFRAQLQSALDQVRNNGASVQPQTMQARWKHLRRASIQDFGTSVVTGVSAEILHQIAHAVVAPPNRFAIYPKLVKILSARKSLWEQGYVDWSMAELLSYGSLLAQGTPIRLSGEDSQRGTFAHRHAVYKSVTEHKDYIPLNHLESFPKQAMLSPFNSPLSEYAVMAFDYGFSLSAPDSLVIWEAQFGDFVNGAQIVLDQYLASAESKWLRCSGLVLLLPHGYEGQGPEHSSARLERFLQNSAQLNWIIAQPTTPANLFHLLRRQVKAPFRKPLVVCTPKSLLRNPVVRSPIADLQDQSRFQEVLLDSVDAQHVTHVVLCTGKVFYDLTDFRGQKDIPHVAIVRIEQLYPFVVQQWKDILAAYPRMKSLAWVQEEPKNMGAARYIQHTLLDWDVRKLTMISREESASTASGFLRISDLQKQQLLSDFYHFVCE